jgi:hypothetical protein
MKTFEFNLTKEEAQQLAALSPDFARKVVDLLFQFNSEGTRFNYERKVRDMILQAGGNKIQAIKSFRAFFGECPDLISEYAKGLYPEITWFSGSSIGLAFAKREVERIAESITPYPFARYYC